MSNNSSNISSFMIIVAVMLLVFNKLSELNFINILLAHKRKGKINMVELLKRMIGKKCLIKTINQFEYVGNVEEIVENAVLVKDKKGCSIILNVEYILSVKETK